MSRQKGDIVYDLFILALRAVCITQTCQASKHPPESTQTSETK